MTLYLVAAPFLNIAISYAAEESNPHIVLLQDAAYEAPKVKAPGQLYVIEEDVAQRGIRSILPSSVHVIGYDQLVDLMETEKVLNFL